MTVMTIELRNPDGSVMNTIRCSDADKSWYDIDPINSPLTVTKGQIDDTAYGQFRCIRPASRKIRNGTVPTAHDLLADLLGRATGEIAAICQVREFRPPRRSSQT